MKLLILGINYAPEKIGIAVYTSDLARSLVQAGHDVRVLTAKPYYPEWQVQRAYRRPFWWSETCDGVRVLRCPIYVPSHPSGVRRLLHHVSFALSALVPGLWSGIRWRPDAVLCVAPSLMAAPVGWAAARLAGSIAWLHIQDFEVEAAVATGLLNGNSKAARLARSVERTIMQLFDRVSSIGPEMCRRLDDLGVSAGRIRQMRNWADLQAIRPQGAQSPYRQELGITTPCVALYSGNIANKQGIEIVVAAARRLKHRHDLTIVICGDGPNRAALEQQAAGCHNIVIAGLQPKDRLSDLLSLATVHLLPQKGDAADLVLPSKLTNMLASGRPVVATAAAGTGLAREVDGCGLVTPPEDEVAFADAIERLLDDASLRDRCSRAARQRAEQSWNKEVTVQGFLDDLSAVVAGGKPVGVGR